MRLGRPWCPPGSGTTAAGWTRTDATQDLAPPSQLAAGYQVFAINPMSVARYRERHSTSTSAAKSDAGDAQVLAEIVRLDHAPITGRSPVTAHSPKR
jgi:hypothetical protein